MTNKSFTRKLFLLAVLFFLFMLQLQATIRYVKPIASGTGDGSSWANASSNLSAMLLASASGDEVWVAAGNYKPDRDPFGNINPPDLRNKTFYIPSGVKLYGGFSGSESSPGLRNISLNATILDGDIGLTGNKTDNCYHVVMGVTSNISAAGVRIDGLIVQNGNADQYSLSSMINGVNVLHLMGGGVFINSGKNWVTNCVLQYNSAVIGGALAVSEGTDTITNTIFLLNNASQVGGGFFNNATGVNILLNNVFASNTAFQGGGAFAVDRNNTFINNTFINNSADNSGGGIHFFMPSASSLISNNIFFNNKVNNNPALQGSDFFKEGGSTNAVLFRNNLLQLDVSNYTTTGNGNYDLGSSAAGNIFNLNPQFADINNINGPDGIPKTSDDGLTLQLSSLCRNSGNNNLIPPGITTDITRGARIYGSAADMGAYETFYCNDGLPRIYVNHTSSTPPSSILAGQSWATAFSSLSDALELARTCNDVNEIWVAGGNYKPTMAYPGNSNPANTRDKTFYLPPDISVFGGFNGTESALSQRNYISNETILSGDIGIIGNNSDNCYHVVVASSSNATLDGFTIRDGNANGSGSSLIGINNLSRRSGGGLYLSQGTNTAINNIITANAADDGAGIKSTGGNNTIINNFIVSNTSNLSGAGISSESASELIANNNISNNSSNNAGGGIYVYQSSIILAGNTIYNNAASLNGGGVMAVDGSGQYSNNIFWNNKKAGSATVPSSDYFRSSFSANNNIFRYNLLQLPGNNYTTTGGSGFYELSTSATGNIFATDPLFILPANVPGPDGKLRTSDDGLIPDACSPVINTGNNSLVPSGLTTDILNNARIQLTTVDMGACEAISNSANQSAGLTTANLAITKSQNASTAYTNDCSTLIALVSSSGASPISGSTTARVWIESTPPASFVKRHYEITPAANAATATGRVTLYFTQQDFTDFNATNVIKLPLDAADAANHKANLRIEKRSGTSNNGTGLPGTYTGNITVIDPADADIVWNSASGRWEVSFDVTGFSGFFVKTTLGILPVNWISFNGSLNANKQAVLNWKVEELNVTRYEIEKSINGNNFIPIGSLPGQGDGNHIYSFTDPAPLSDQAYYRIRQVDADGRYSYSTVIRLKTNGQETLTVYPNPVKNYVQITSGKKQTVAVYDASGKTIRVLPVIPGTVSVNTEGWSKGLYILKTETGETIKLVKE